jgi:hypothetical protein
VPEQAQVMCTPASFVFVNAPDWMLFSMQDRFRKFRGLKSFRTSAWDPKEDLPPEYAKIFAFENFSRARKLAAKTTERAVAVRCNPHPAHPSILRPL